MRTVVYGRKLLKALAVSAFFIFPVTAKQHPDAHIQLLRPVELTAQEQLFVSTLPALKMLSSGQRFFSNYLFYPAAHREQTAN